MADNKDTKDEMIPAQIPLLDDVAFHTSLPLPVKKRPVNHKPALSEPAPRATDLFGGANETEVSGSDMANSPAVEQDTIRKQLEEKTSVVIDSLVQEYSDEIVRRLRDELSSILNDLDLDGPEEPKT